jgi:hypothetical protein
MRAINHWFWLGLTLAASSGSTHGAPGNEKQAGPVVNSCSLSAQSRHEEGPGLLPCDRAYVRAGTNNFAFLIPGQLQLRPWNSASVALVSHDYSRQIIIRFASQALADPGELSLDAASQWLSSTYPHAKVLNTFSLSADSRRGPAFEIAFAGAANSARRGVVAFIPSRLGVLEFSLATSPEQFAAARQQLNTVMLTFRVSDPNGELRVSPLSDKL